MANIFNKLIILFIALGSQMNQKKEQTDDYEIYVNQIIKSFAKDMKKQYGLSCSGSGGKMPYDVEEIQIDFISQNHATIDEARVLEIAVTEKFLNAINSNEKIRPFLREFPFKPERAQVGIAFRKPDMRPYTDGSVAYVFQVRNRIFYNADSETSPTLISLTEEPYDEALKIVNESAK